MKLSLTCFTGTYFRAKGPSGVGVAPRTYSCPICGKSMIRAAENIQRHEYVHGRSITLGQAYRMAQEDLGTRHP